MEQIFNCKLCDATFTKKTSLDNHRRQNHQLSCKILGVLVNKDERGFKCPCCKNYFLNAKSLSNHAKKCQEKLSVDETMLVESVPPFVVDESVPPFVVEPVEAVLALEISNSIFECPVFKGLNVTFNTKFALLICKTCNIGLKQERSALLYHFQNQVHVKSLVSNF